MCGEKKPIIFSSVHYQFPMRTHAVSYVPALHVRYAHTNKVLYCSALHCFMCAL